MNVLFIGDVVAKAGCEKLQQVLPTLKRQYNAAVTVVNGENSADGNGITPGSLQMLFDAGADVVTTGNHAFRRRECYDAFETQEFLLRPANFPASAPGKGVCVIDRGAFRMAVVNLMGAVNMHPQLSDPFATMDAVLTELAQQGIRTVLLDFHAEATGEKRALAFYLDGRVSAFVGTHTHVQTADEEILPNGTAYLTDAGMSGPTLSCLGVEPSLAIAMMKDKLPERFTTAQPPCTVHGADIEIDPKTGRSLSIQRICVK